MVVPSMIKVNILPGTAGTTNVYPEVFTLAYNQHQSAYRPYYAADIHNYDLPFAAASANAFVIIHVDEMKVIEEKTGRFVRSQCPGCITPDEVLQSTNDVTE